MVVNDLKGKASDCRQKLCKSNISLVQRGRRLYGFILLECTVTGHNGFEEYSTGLESRNMSTKASKESCFSSRRFATSVAAGAKMQSASGIFSHRIIFATVEMAAALFWALMATQTCTDR